MLTAQEQEMDLPWLEEHLGVTYFSCKRGQVLLPRDKFQWLKQQTEDDGTTLLMKAAKKGEADCVELLLMCGVNVNECRSIECEVQRAIHFAIECDHRKVVEILLKWDSILPDSDSESLIDKLKSMREENEDIKKFFKERDKFHELIRNGDICAIERILKSREDDVNNSRIKHWVNSDGESSLYTAVTERKYDVRALLLSRKFESLETETKRIEFLQSDKVQSKKFDRAMNKYYSETPNGHLFDLLSRTRSFGGSNEKKLNFQTFVQGIYNDANQVPEAKLLMQCLQHDSLFQVIFELDRPDVKNVCSMASSEVIGLMHPHLHRVYASACLETHAKVVSNLIHEFCHRVIYHVFLNKGLPYKMSDEKMQNAYKEIFNKIMSNIHNCDPIIQRVNNYNNFKEQEVIVRIPEIITEGKIGGKEVIEWNTDIEKELSNFYHDHVEKQINHQIKIESKRPRDFDPSFISSYHKDYAQVGELEKPAMCLHHGIKYIRVSDLSLGISHMKESLGDVTVDQSFFMRHKTYFVAQLERGDFQNLMVVWDNGTEFCSNPNSCSCLANIFQTHGEYVTLIVPKELKSCNKEKCVDYEWMSLSERTKEWVLKQHVIFQGTDIVLQDLLKDSLYKKEAEYTINAIIGPNDVSLMIQQKKYVVGNDVASDLEKKIGEMLYGHPQTFFPRRTKLRPLSFDEELIQQRKMDAIFFLHTTENELKEANVSDIRLWEGEKTKAEGVRHFFLKENIDAAGRRKYCQKIGEELRKVPNSDVSWRYAHFFLKSKKDFIHIHSVRINDQRCLLLADEPGSGKSVFLHSEARNEKLKDKNKWVEVVTLTDCEDVFKNWMGTKQNLGVEDCLYQLTNRRRVNSDDRTHEKQLFSLFCQTEERVVIYFDGFDEICPAFKEIVSSFLKKLLDNTRVNFFVTTRTNQREDLEKRLNTIAHTLVPLDSQEQVQFINRQWNCMLKLLPKESRIEKIAAITAKCKNQGYIEMDIISTENMGEGSNQYADDQDYNFDKAAEVLIRNDKPHPEKKEYFSEIPLHAYIMAFECFENNLFTHKSLNTFLLFKKVVEFKIKLYLKEKEKVPEGNINKTFYKRIKAFLFENLKKFSVNFYPVNITYNPSGEEKDEMLSTGILVEREGSYEFIHQKFAEYLFCCRLFDEDANLRDVLYEKVLLDEEFETVRNFIDAMILSDRSEENAIRNDRVAELTKFQSLLREGKTHGITLYRMIYRQAILENHAGILQFLGALPREYLSTVMFMDSNDDSNTFREEESAELKSAFTLFTEGIHERMNKERPKYIMMHTLLEIAEKNNLIAHLGEYISKKGLRWTGVGMWDVTKMSHFKHFCWILNLFFKHKETLKEPLKKCLMGTEGNYFSQRASCNVSTFEALRSLSDTIFMEEDF